MRQFRSLVFSHFEYDPHFVTELPNIFPNRKENRRILSSRIVSGTFCLPLFDFINFLFKPESGAHLISFWFLLIMALAAPWASWDTTRALWPGRTWKSIQQHRMRAICAAAMQLQALNWDAREGCLEEAKDVRRRKLWQLLCQPQSVKH